MPTIGALTYQLVAKTDQFQQGMIGSARALRDQKKLFLSTRTDAEKYGLAIKRLEDLHRKGKITDDVYARSVRNIRDEMAKSLPVIATYSSRMAGVRKGLNSSAIASRSGAVAIGAFSLGMADVIRRSARFEQTLAESTAIMSGVTDDIRKRMTQTALTIAATTKFSAKEAAESYFFLASAGLNAEQSIRAVGLASTFAQAGNFDMATATDLLTDAQSALGLTVKDTAENMRNMARVGDVLVKANTLANASVEQFSAALTNKSAAAMRNYGIAIEAGVATLAVFADQNMKGEVGGTAYSIVLRDLTTKALENEEAFKKAGIAVFGSNEEVRLMPDIIKDVEDHLDGMSGKMKTATLLQLGFTIKSVGFLQSLVGTSEQMREYQTELDKASGTMQDIADKSMTDLTLQLNELSVIWETFASTIGPIFTSFLASSGDEVSFFAKVLATLADVFHAVSLAVRITWVAMTAFTDLDKASESIEKLKNEFLDDTPGQKFLAKLEQIENQQRDAEQNRVAAAAQQKTDDAEQIDRTTAKMHAAAELETDRAKAAEKERVDLEKTRAAAEKVARSRAESITKSFATETEKIAGQKDEISRLFLQGLIGKDTLDRAFDSFAEKADKAAGLKGEVSARPSTISAVHAGSIEALRLQNQSSGGSPDERTAKGTESLVKTGAESLKAQKALVVAFQAFTGVPLLLPAKDA